MVFNRDFVLLTSGFRRISTAAKESGSDVAHEKLAFDGVDQIKISEPGYVYIYLSNENPTTVEVYFDDFKVEHIKSAVVQTEDYYPFGLGYNSYLRQDYLLNHWKFQGQDHIDDLALNWDSFRWRNHQPEIGRFFSIDPLSTKYYYNSPYAFSENKVVAHRELEGLESFPSNCEGCSTGERKEYYKQQTKAHMEAFWRAIPGAVQGTAEKMASMSDANDIIVIVTTITRGENAVNIDDSKATTTDKVFAGVGIVLPVVSGSAAKKIATEVGGALFEGIMKKVGNISTHLTDNDVAGAIKDIMGKPIIINGKQYDHLDEVTSALRGLGNQIEKLNKLISSGDLSKESIKEAERIRSSLQNEKDKIQNILNKAKNEAKDQ
jgi:RHS repeat-associated protein